MNALLVGSYLIMITVSITDFLGDGGKIVKAHSRDIYSRNIGYHLHISPWFSVQVKTSRNYDKKYYKFLSIANLFLLQRCLNSCSNKSCLNSSNNNTHPVEVVTLNFEQCLINVLQLFNSLPFLLTSINVLLRLHNPFSLKSAKFGTKSRYRRAETGRTRRRA